MAFVNWSVEPFAHRSGFANRLRFRESAAWAPSNPCLDRRAFAAGCLVRAVPTFRVLFLAFAIEIWFGRPWHHARTQMARRSHLANFRCLMSRDKLVRSLCSKGL